MFGTYEDEPIVFENWQIEDLHDYSRVRIREKAPQIGFSWLRAAEATWEAMMFDDVIAGFISVDQREAQNKITYALKLYDGLPEQFKDWVPMFARSSEELKLGQETRPSVIASYPATSGMRGRRMSVTIDEADFMKDGGKDAFRAGVGRIARSKNLRLTMGSTCWGQDTEIDRLMHGLTDDGDRDSRQIQSIARYPEVVTEKEDQREGIELARMTLDPVDFEEEYNCVRGGTANDPFPADLLRRQTHEYEPWPVDSAGRLEVPTSAPVIAGYDVGGGGGNPSVISCLEQMPSKVWRQMALHVPTRNNVGLTIPQQEEWLAELLRRVPNLRLCIDAKGIGLGTTQKLQGLFGQSRVVQIISGAKPGGALSDLDETQEKDQMIVELQRMLEGAEIEILPDVEQKKQFTRTRKSRSYKGKFEQAGSRRQTHFDKFWATCYASYGVRASGRGLSAYSRKGLTVLGGEMSGVRW
jgi:phage FluMu gp28-like protein